MLHAGMNGAAFSTTRIAETLSIGEEFDAFAAATRAATAVATPAVAAPQNMSWGDKITLCTSGDSSLYNCVGVAALKRNTCLRIRADALRIASAIAISKPDEGSGTIAVGVNATNPTWLTKSLV
jgi:hypothetical protein